MRTWSWPLDCSRVSCLALAYTALCIYPLARPLSIIERLWLHQLPLLFDSLLGGLEPDKSLPFKDSLAPDLFVSIFCQL
jgi:hypothetical protein